MLGTVCRHMQPVHLNSVSVCIDSDCAAAGCLYRYQWPNGAEMKKKKKQKQVTEKQIGWRPCHLSDRHARARVHDIAAGGGSRG